MTARALNLLTADQQPRMTAIGVDKAGQCFAKMAHPAAGGSGVTMRTINIDTHTFAYFAKYGTTIVEAR